MQQEIEDVIAFANGDAVMPWGGVTISPCKWRSV